MSKLIGIDLGTTTYYTSSTYDFLTCIQEMVRGANYGLQMPVTGPGLVRVLPRQTVSDTPAAGFATDMEPSTPGERVILSHSLTQHWMAEKATVAMLAENATESGLPLAFGRSSTSSRWRASSSTSTAAWATTSA